MALFELPYNVADEELEEGYHVHHSYALRLLERARLAYMAAAGFPDSRLRESGILLVIASLSIRYLRELFAGPIVVSVDSVDVREKGIVVVQTILNARGKAAVKATVECVPLSLTTRRSVFPPPELVKALTKTINGEGEARNSATFFGLVR